MKQKQIRQGDVFFERVTKPTIKLTPVPRKNGEIIIALGETTGHKHVIIDDNCQEFIDDLGVTWIECKEAVMLLHLDGSNQPTVDHGQITIQKGWLKRRQQHEYTPSEIRRVAD